MSEIFGFLRSSPRTIATAGAAALVLLVLAGLTAGPAMAAQVAAGCAWSVVAAQDPGQSVSSLEGVAAVSATNVWAVGLANPGGTSQPLVEHWDGASWSVVSTPSTGTGTTGSLSRVSARAANDIWAVGEFQAGGVISTLAEHWDGSSWQIVSTPNPNPLNVNRLSDVVALSASEAWAVGTTEGASAPTHTLIEHWSGGSWTVAASVDPGTTQNELLGIAAAAANNIITTGFSSSGAGRSTLIERWGGASWAQDTTPSPGTNENLLLGPAAVSATEFWAVGTYSNGADNSITALHFTGGSWSQSSPVNPQPTGGQELGGAVALGSGDVWGVGSDHGAGGFARTLAEHWDGSAWSVVPTPSPNTNNNGLNYVAAVSPVDLWAVGDQGTMGTTNTLVEHFTCPGAAAPAVSAPQLPRAAPAVSAPQLPRAGRPVSGSTAGFAAVLGTVLLTLGLVALGVSRRRRT